MVKTTPTLLANNSLMHLFMINIFVLNIFTFSYQYITKILVLCQIFGSDLLINLHVIGAPESKNHIFSGLSCPCACVCMYVCERICVWMCVYLQHEWFRSKWLNLVFWILIKRGLKLFTMISQIERLKNLKINRRHSV